jgi:ABC-type sugar transport system permease subunit
VPTALSALAFWWIYDAQFSIISWSLFKLGLIDAYIDFLGEPWLARLSVIAANIWRGIPFVAICLLAGLQTISPSLYEAAALDGATPWQRFRFVTLPLLTPIIAVVMTFSVLFTFTDFQLIYVITRGGPLNSTQPHGGHFSSSGRDLGRARWARVPHRPRRGPIPFGGQPLQRLRPAAPQLAAGADRLMTRKLVITGRVDLPEVVAGRVVNALHPDRDLPLRLPLPFYWMVITSFNPTRSCLTPRGQSVLGGGADGSHTSKKLLFQNALSRVDWNTVVVSVVSTFFSLAASVFAAYASKRLRFKGSKQTGSRSSSPTWCRPRSSSSRSPPSSSSWASSTPSGR